MMKFIVLFFSYFLRIKKFAQKRRKDDISFLKIQNCEMDSRILCRTETEVSLKIVVQ